LKKQQAASFELTGENFGLVFPESSPLEADSYHMVLYYPYMDWIRSHPYASSLGGACVLVIIGAIFVFKSTPQMASLGLSTWNGNPGTITSTNTANTGASPVQAVTNPAPQQYATTTLPYKTIVPAANSQGTIATQSTSTSFDYDTLLAEISAQTNKPAAQPASASNTTTAGVDAWSFIPSGLIGTTSPSTGRTPAEQALYAYGNEIGSYVEGYDAENSNQSQVLSDATNDRHNATKAAAVEAIGQDLETIGEGIGETTGVPAVAQGANTALADSYIEIGKDLVIVGQSESLSDSTLATAIENYDSAVGTFNKSYIALATLFLENSVTFSSGDPGSVFSFNSSSNSL
jgi:hypothetical protein